MKNRFRGVTLIELLVTVAIFSILMLAALSVFVAMTETQRLNERISEATANKMTGAATIHFDMQNAGYRLPVPAFAIRHVNNVDGTTALDAVGSAAGTPITTAGNCGAGMGLVAGTDVIEMARGAEIVGPGTIGAATNAGTTGTVTLNSATSTVDAGAVAPPFLGSDVASPATALNGSVLVFARGPARPPAAPDDGALCMGRVTGHDPATFRLDIEFLDRDFAPATATYYSNCPQAGMRAYRMVERLRYMVCAPTAGVVTPPMRRLFRQRGGATGNWAAPEELQAGVENLQVSGRYVNTAGAVLATPGNAASCTGTGNTRLCYCDDVAAPGTPSCTTPTAALTALGPTSFVALMRGARIQITATGDRAALSNTAAQNFRRPASFDSPQGAALDNFVRVVDTITFAGSNFSVVP